MATTAKILASDSLTEQLNNICYPSGKVKRQTIKQLTACNTSCGNVTINLAISRLGQGVQQKLIHNMVLGEGDTLSVLEGSEELVLLQGEELMGSADSSGVVEFIATGVEET